VAGTHREDSSDASFAAWMKPGRGTATTIHCPFTLDRIVHAAREFGLLPDELPSLTIVAFRWGHAITVYAGNARGEAFLAELCERGYGTVLTGAWL
jgi:hypothetical protein